MIGTQVELPPVAVIEAVACVKPVPIAVIEGDQQTDADARRIRETGVPAIQINTGKGCHLDAHMIGHALDELPSATDGVLFIENVGNLVCPAGFDLGEAHKIVVLSGTEGEDKPLKYPDIFAAADLVFLHRVTSDLPGVFELADLLAQITLANCDLVSNLQSMQNISQLAETIDQLESAADRVFRRVTSELFSGRHDALDILRWKEIVEAIEKVQATFAKIDELLEAARREQPRLVREEVYILSDLGRNTWAIDLTRRVLASPGAPVMRQCPPAKSARRICSTTSCCCRGGARSRRCGSPRRTAGRRPRWCRPPGCRPGARRWHLPAAPRRRRCPRWWTTPRRRAPPQTRRRGLARCGCPPQALRRELWRPSRTTNGRSRQSHNLLFAPRCPSLRT
mgnify:CR=1 FL=1